MTTSQGTPGRDPTGSTGDATFPIFITDGDIERP